MYTWHVKEAGAKAILENFLIIRELNLVNGVLMLTDLFFEFNERLIELLSLLVQFGEVIDRCLIIFGDFDV